jgi:hypothetical protein
MYQFFFSASNCVFLEYCHNLFISLFLQYFLDRLCFDVSIFFSASNDVFRLVKKKIHRWAIDKRNMFHLFIGYFCSIFWIDCVSRLCFPIVFPDCVSRCIIFFFSLKRCFSAGQKKKYIGGRSIKEICFIYL